jgi:hypothetical protein
MDKEAYRKLVEILNEIDDELVLTKLTNVIDARIETLGSTSDDDDDDEDDDTDDDEDDEGDDDDNV